MDLTSGLAHALRIANQALGWLCAVGFGAFLSLLFVRQPIRRARLEAPLLRDFARIFTVVGLMALFVSSGLAVARAETSKRPSLTCDSSDRGIWARLDRSNHDNLVQVPDRARVAPGEAIAVALRWEWRDWKPGTKLQLRACSDLDGPKDQDEKATAPHEGPQFDFETIHPNEAPESRGGDKDRRVVNHTISLRVPENATHGEFCTRVAVMGDPKDHVGSPPTFDIAETVCLPIAASPSAGQPPGQQPPGQPPGGQPPAQQPPCQPPGQQPPGGQPGGQQPPACQPPGQQPPGGQPAPLSPPSPRPLKALPVTGGLDAKPVGLAVSLIGLGLLMQLMGKRAKKKPICPPRP